MYICIEIKHIKIKRKRVKAKKPIYPDVEAKIRYVIGSYN